MFLQIMTGYNVKGIKMVYLSTQPEGGNYSFNMLNKILGANCVLRLIIHIGSGQCMSI